MAFPTDLTNAVDGLTNVLAAHINNLEAKIGIDNSAVITSLDYLVKTAVDPGHTHTTGGGSGDVIGPSSAVDSNFVGFDTATGKLIKDSGSKAADFATAGHNHTGTYAPAANGITGGDSHDHSGGDGAQIDHGGLAGLGDDDHTQYVPKVPNILTFASADATPSIAGGDTFKTANLVDTTITYFDDPVDGKTITIFVEDSHTIIDFTGTNLKRSDGLSEDLDLRTGSYMLRCTKFPTSSYIMVSWGVI